MNPKTANLNFLIDHAKAEHIRLLIEVDKSDYVVLYCDKTEKRNILKQIRLNKIKTRIKIVTHDYKIMFPEEPELIELNYVRGRVVKTFLKERVIKTYSKFVPQKLYDIITVDFPEMDNIELIQNLKDHFFTNTDVLKLILTDLNIPADVNRDRDTFIIYYREGGE